MVASAVSLHVSQRGFIPTPGFEQNLLLLDKLIKHAKKNNLNISVMFLDLAKKAFHSINHHLIQAGLERMGVPEQVCIIVQDLYEWATSHF